MRSCALCSSRRARAARGARLALPLPDVLAATNESGDPIAASRGRSSPCSLGHAMYGWPNGVTTHSVTTNVRARSFAHFDLHPTLHRALQARGLLRPTPIQASAVLVPPGEPGCDWRTGSGKTLAFLLPLGERARPDVGAVHALVLVATRELAIQVGTVRPRSQPRGGFGTPCCIAGARSVPNSMPSSVPRLSRPASARTAFRSWWRPMSRRVVWTCRKLVR